MVIEQILERCEYNVAAAARMLGTTRETLRYRMRKYSLRKHRPAALDSHRSNVNNTARRRSD